MDNYEYFGIPETNLRAARQFSRKQKNYKFNIEVPTRKDVKSMPATQIKEAMLAWMCRSVTEIIPSRSQIFEAKSILLTREDVLSLSELIKMCDHYIDGE